MYKHFAAATLTLTAGIAMFADDGHRGTAAGQIAAYGSSHELAPAPSAAAAQASATPVLVRRDTATPGSFGEETRASLGTGGGGRAVRSPAASHRIAVPGFDQAFIDGLSEEEYRALLETLPSQADQAHLSPAERAAQRAAVEAASARRAGASGPGRDAPG